MWKWRIGAAYVPPACTVRCFETLPIIWLDPAMSVKATSTAARRVAERAANIYAGPLRTMRIPGRYELAIRTNRWFDNSVWAFAVTISENGTMTISPNGNRLG